MNRPSLLSVFSITFATLLGIAAASPSDAKTFRYSSANDYQTADPHSQNTGPNNALNGQVYEGLVERGRNLEIEPRLATSWKQTGPNTWVFNLRKGVKFHNGADFTADDVVFSIIRLQGQSSTFRTYANAVGKPRAIDAHTVEFTTPEPNPVILEMLVNMFMMDRDWSVKNKVERAQDMKNNEESFAARNANGTGPFILVQREPDVRAVFRKNPQWWGIAEKMFTGNVTEMIYRPIRSDATRMAALTSGELDFVQDPAVQNIEQLKKNPQLKVYEGRENRVIFFGFDTARKELLYSNVKGKNPFADIRVRQAVYQAIDVNAIQRSVMRGLSIPTGIVHPNPDAAKLPADLQKRLPFDASAAKKLLTDAGYPNGFEVTLDCPNNRYVNDERICIAVAGMLARIGIKVRVNAMPLTTYFPKVEKLDTSFYLLGWGGSTTDPIFTLQPVFHSRNNKGDGDYNYGNTSDAKLDAAIDLVKGETDLVKRQAAIIEAYRVHNAGVFRVPLHLQVIPWASRANVTVVHRADNWLEGRWVVMK
jgi:peptide/nickel transport system substrate-binding protein